MYRSRREQKQSAVYDRSRNLSVYLLFLRKSIPIIQGLVQNSLIIFQKQEQIMVYSISDFKVHQYGIPLTKI